jgi:hypothetical protein
MMAQGGNVYEWQATEWDLTNDNSASVRDLRSAARDVHSIILSGLFRTNESPEIGPVDAGFRVASVPKPSTLWLAGLAVAGLLLRRSYCLWQSGNVEGTEPS